MALPTFSEAAALPERTLLSMAVSRKKPNGDSIDVVEKKRFVHGRHTHLLNLGNAAPTVGLVLGLDGPTALLGLIATSIFNGVVWVQAHNMATTPTDDSNLQWSYALTSLGASVPGQLFLDEKWFGEGGESFTTECVIFISTDEDDPVAPGDPSLFSISVNAVPEPAD